MNFKEFDMFLNHLKEIDPELKEEIIHPILYRMIKNSLDHKLSTWVKQLTETYKEHAIIVKEIDYLFSAFLSLEESLIKYRVDDSYTNLKRGYLLPDEQVYARQIIPIKGQGLSIFWSTKKAVNIIKKQGIKKTYFPIQKMNIDIDELDQEFLPKALHNKKPGILVRYEPFSGYPYESFLMDGNHRIHANYLLKKKENYPVIILESEQTIETMIHPFYQYFYLLHCLERQLFETPKNGGDFEEILVDRTSKYNRLKMLVVEEK